jgi:hypothetical protein
MTQRQERVKVIIITGLIITAVAWSVDVVTDVFIDNEQGLIDSLLRPGVNETAERLAVIIILIGIIGYFFELNKSRIGMLKEHEDLKRTVGKLIADKRTLKKLKSLLPTCPDCDSIRDNIGAWHELDTYLYKFPETIYTEGYCPGCTRKRKLEREAEELAKKGVIGQA